MIDGEVTECKCLTLKNEMLAIAIATVHSNDWSDGGPYNAGIEYDFHGKLCCPWSEQGCWLICPTTAMTESVVIGSPELIR